MAFKKKVILFVSLSELHLSLNKYEEVDLPDSSCHRSVTKLFVNECKLHNWKDIDKLGKSFPCLESLNVIKSALTTIEEDRIKECFPALKALNISGNPVESWEEIDKLRLFPALESLRIFEVPLFEVSKLYSTVKPVLSGHSKMDKKSDLTDKW